MARGLRFAAAAAAAIGAAVGATGAMAVPASAAGVTVGSLTCNVQSGWGFVFGSSRALNCVFHSSLGHNEHYVGRISKFGADIGYTEGGVLIWDVVAPTANLGPGALAGGYAGGTASATVGVGVGANALIGGSHNSIALQPLSIEGNRGLNIAAGIADITLTYAR